VTTANISSSESHVVSFSQSKASVSLDAIRGTAALLVCSDHLRHALFVEYHGIVSHRSLLFIPYLITAAGHQAVVIFFVLSGFLVGGTVLRPLEQKRWTWKIYVTHRFLRLWIVLLPALMLGALWDRLSIYNHWPGYGGAVFQHFFPKETFAATMTLPVFLGNAAFLQGILFPTFGSNVALWSLSNEFWYYILFPLAIFAMRPYYKPITRLLFAVGFVLLSFFVGKSFMEFFLIWLAGTILLIVPRPSFDFPVRVLATIGYLISFLSCVALSHNHGVLSDYLLTIATTLFIWVLLAGKERSSGGKAERFGRSIARFSYTLYVVHMPFMYFLTGFIIHSTWWYPTVPHLVIALILFFAILLYAWIIATATEFHMGSVRNWVESGISSTKVSQAPLS
jgi:peptidoglycan/LPS O-acetylase OafA/YrhL